MSNQVLFTIQFMTRSEVISRHRIPKHLQEELFKDMPVATMSEGKPLYVKWQVKAFLKEKFPYPPAVAPFEKVVSMRPRGGRKVTTDEEAIYARDLKKEGKSYKEIVSLMKIRFPERAETFTVGSVPKCIARYEKREERKEKERTHRIDPKSTLCVSGRVMD